MQDDPIATADEATQQLATRLKTEREARGWSIAELAERSGVSRAMISKVERGEASPTAALLGRLSGPFGLTVSALLARAEAAAPGGVVVRVAEQALWRDPGTGYLRRMVSPPGANPELVQVELPPGARVPYPAASYALLDGRCIWLLEGELLFHEGARTHRLAAGDCLALGLPADCAYENPSATQPCRYVVAVARR
ncbi:MULTISPECIES: helix-turn-helix domain-containing protein [Roseomonadaceae]|uniref:Helix-turn-helix domain-containing protein n=1 Tax=Falsiroseomonas oleicola TaxID=2801474 RepID=A0ABS6H6Q2_9PROT|nr:XRE family transcriptional regulator [Roseomonas oleicola]MBU8544366.1 helix-turn-helix domain-containing protein [Roseomonas oleicola]